MQNRLTVRTEWTKPLELRPLRSRRRLVHLDRLLERREDGREQRGGGVDHLQRSWDREAVLPGGEELETVPARPRQLAAGVQQLADRVAVVPPLPRLPAEHLAARAIPHLRRRSIEQHPFVGLLPFYSPKPSICFHQLCHR